MKKQRKTTPQRFTAEARRTRAVELALEGYSHYQIAEKLKVEGYEATSRPTVSLDLRKAREEMLEARVEECAADRARVLRMLERDMLKLDDFETRALAALDKSNSDRVRERTKYTAEGDKPHTTRERLRRLLRGGGSPAWGRVYIQAIDARTRALKLYTDVSGSAAPRKVNVRLEELRRQLAGVLSIDPDALPE